MLKNSEGLGFDASSVTNAPKTFDQTHWQGNPIGKCDVTDRESPIRLGTRPDLQWECPQQLDLPMIYLVWIHSYGLEQADSWAAQLGHPDLSMGKTIELGTSPWS